MARAAITVNNITTTASAIPAETNGDATEGHYVATAAGTGGGSGVWLLVRNADAGGAHTISIGYPVVDGGQAVTPKAYSIPASSSRNIRLGSPKVHGTRTNIDVDSSQIKIVAYKLA